MTSTDQPDQRTLERAKALDLYREMLRIRRFEEKLYELVSRGKIGGTTHLCIGQEAVAVGVSAGLTRDDLVVSTHRGHGHLLAKGARLDRALAEIAGRETGYCRGKGGSQHVAVPDIGHLGSNGITGGGLPIAAGLALAQKLKQTECCVVSYSGDGAADTGNFHETLNLAALWRLPVVFVLENNFYSMSTHVERTSACASFVDWAVRYRGMRVVGPLDGNDVLGVVAGVEPLLAAARSGQGPCFVEFLTYRQAGHSKSDARVYRTREEEAEWRRRDPFVVLAQRAGLEPDEIALVEDDVAKEIEEAAAFAMGSPAGGRELALSDLEPPPPTPGAAPNRVEVGAEITMTEAVREVLRSEMQRDADVVIIGEDIGVYGGAFGVTRGLLDEFGEERIRETPISENSFTGLGVGAAVGGLRPVVELMFGDFVAYAMDALVNHAAKLRYMYAGQVRVPFTLRMPVGRRNGYGATHSQSLEAWFTHVPGLHVVFPSRVEDAVGLLRTCIRTDVPTLFLEHKLLYPAKGTWPPPGELVPLGAARIDRSGDDLTLITYGLCLQICREAADVLETRGYSVEIVDLRSLQPFDRAACIASVQKTGRSVFVQETTGVGGTCDRVIADILPDVFGWLRAPIEKVCGEHAPMPASPELEAAIMPSARDVMRTALRLLSQY